MNWYLRKNIERLGIIASNISILLAVFAVAMPLSFILYVLFYLLFVLVTVATLGLIFLFFPSLWDFFQNGAPAKLEGFATFINAASPYFFVFSIVAVAISLTCLFIADPHTHKGRIIFGFVLLGVVLLSIILYAGGAQID